MRTCLRTIAPGLALLAAGVLARAGEVTFTGYTDGCFGAACTPPNQSTLQRTTGFGVINFANGDFSGTTSGGMAVLNAAGNAFGLNMNNLGAMDQFAIGTGTAINGTFRLRVTFTLPFAASAIFDATVTGTDGASGHSTITFSNTPVQFSSGGTSLLLTVTGVSLAANGADIAIVGTIGSAITTPIFTDVNPSDFFYNAVNLLYGLHITAGCSTSPLMYCPNANVTRGQMAVFITRAVLGGDPVSYTQTPYFTDVPSSHPFFKWIQALRDLNITAGCGPQLYCPDNSVTRDQMAVFIIRARYGASATFSYPSTPYFSDVPSSNPFFSWIQKMAQIGITAGCGPQVYCPGNPVTRGQMAILIMRGTFNQLLPLGTPMISGVSPAAVMRGQTINVALSGANTNFVQGTTQVSAGVGITVNSVTVTNSQSLTANLTISAGAMPGPRSLVATTGTEEAVLPNGLVVQ